MGSYRMNEESVQGFRSDFWREQNMLSELCGKIRDLQGELADQQGFGIEAISAQIGVLAGRVNNISGQLGDFAYYLGEVINLTNEAEKGSAAIFDSFESPYNIAWNASAQTKPSVKEENSNVIRVELGNQDTPTGPVVITEEKSDASFIVGNTKYENVVPVKQLSQKDYTYWGSGSYNSACYVTSIAMCLGMLTGKTYSEGDMRSWCDGKMLNYGKLKNKTKAGSTNYSGQSNAAGKVLADAAKCLEKGKPCVVGMERNGGSGTHYVAVIGIREGADKNRLTESDFLVADPMVPDRYTTLKEALERTKPVRHLYGRMVTFDNV